MGRPFLAGFCLALLVAGPSASAAPPERVAVAIGFECLWWSSDQMAGLDPNHPPPKTTRVRLDKWEYSDPVGVPHPDTIDVTIDVANGAATVQEPLEVAVQWKTRQWRGRRVVFRRPLSLGPGERRRIVVPLRCAAKSMRCGQARCG